MPDFVTESFADMYKNMGYLTRSLIMSYYLGWIDREPVGASMLMLGAGVAGIYNVATIPEAQRRGIGSAMTLESISEARILGYRIGILGATEMGYKIYLRLGFQEYCKF